MSSRYAALPEPASAVGPQSADLNITSEQFQQDTQEINWLRSTLLLIKLFLSVSLQIRKPVREKLWSWKEKLQHVGADIRNSESTDFMLQG